MLSNSSIKSTFEFPSEICIYCQVLLEAKIFKGQNQTKFENFLPFHFNVMHFVPYSQRCFKVKLFVHKRVGNSNFHSASSMHGKSAGITNFVED